MSSYHYKCVLIILNVSSYTAQKKTVPTKTVNVSSYYYKRVLIILNVSSYTAKTKKKQLFSAEWVAEAAITDDKIVTASIVK